MSGKYVVPKDAYLTSQDLLQILGLMGSTQRLFGRDEQWLAACLVCRLLQPVAASSTTNEASPAAGVGWLQTLEAQFRYQLLLWACAMAMTA